MSFCAAKRGRSPMKNVLGLNVDLVSSCWEHAKDLATMTFLDRLPWHSCSFSLLHPSNLISLSWDPGKLAGFLVLSSLGFWFSPFLDLSLIILTFFAQFSPFHRLFWAVHNQQVSLVKPFLTHFHPLPLYHELYGNSAEADISFEWFDVISCWSH